MRWVIFILALLLVWNFSKSWSTVPGFTEIISLALSLSSLLLALIAIFQTSLSSSQQTESISDMRRAAENVVSVSDELKLYSSTLESRLTALDAVPKTLSDVNQKVNEIAAAKTSPSDSNSDKSQPKIIGDSFNAEEAMKSSSILTIDALYAALLSFENKKPFQNSDYDATNQAEYKDGVYAGLKMPGLLKATYKNNVYVINDLGAFNRKNIVAACKFFLKDPIKKALIREDLLEIEKFFGVSPANSVVSEDD